MSSNSYDVAIIGGGIMGCAVAYYLMKRDARLKTVVIEMDPAYTRASTTLSMSNIRIQFSLKENVQISRFAFEVFEKFADTMTVEDQQPQINFRREGNLFMVDAGSEASARKSLSLQQSLGCKVDWWSRDRIRTHYPLYDVTGLAGGTFGEEDGHIDAYAALMGYRRKARHLGAEYIHEQVVQIRVDSGRVTGVELRSGNRLKSRVVVNCAGAWAAAIAHTAGIELPVQPIKRQVFALDTAVKPTKPLPLTVLPSGLYFRSETGGLILLGKSMDDDPTGFDFSWDDKRFTEILWPELAAFVPAFDTLKLVRGWAGLYAVNTLDGNAVLGEWPHLKGLYLANGFSGHGLQQAPAVGRYISERILTCKPSLDLSIFGPERILEQKPLSEIGLV
jgi:glycine/D-amino acid oxidase-like deaminating enzyme